MRFLTIETEDCTIEAFTESEDWKSAIDRAQEWVWQEADSKEQAIRQHEEKHDKWTEDQLRGTEKFTY